MASGWTRRIIVVTVVLLIASFAPLPAFVGQSVSVVDRQAAAFEPMQADDLTELPDPELEHPDGAHVEHADAEVGDSELPDADLEIPQPGVVDPELTEPEVGDRLIASEENSGEFEMIGVDFDELPEEPVFARVQNLDGSWQEWRELEANPDEGPDGEVTTSTSPLWVGEAAGWEVSVDASDGGADVVVVREEEKIVAVDSTPVAESAVSSPVTIKSRASWDAQPASAVNYGSEVKLAVVHHSVTTNSYSAAQVPGILRGIQAYHQQGNGWSDIGYNFAVDKFGGAWEARQGGMSKPVIGAHAKGFNTNSVGIVVLGDYSSVNPSGAATETVAKLAGWKLMMDGHDPSASANFTSGGSTSIPAGVVVNLPRVVGHQQVGSTACPGRVLNYLSSIRTRAQAWADWLTANLAPFGVVDGVSSSGGQLRVRGWAVDPSGSEAHVTIASKGVWRTVETSVERPDVAAAYPGNGSALGFDEVVGSPSYGWQSVCVTAGGQNRDTSLGCSNITISDPSGLSPTGVLPWISVGPGTVNMSGWVNDSDAAQDTTISVLVDKKTVASGKATGGSYNISASGITSGAHTVCVKATNQGGGQSVWLGCYRPTFPGANPVGTVWTMTPKKAQVEVSGWVLDPETTSPVAIRVTIDGHDYGSLPANQYLSGLRTAYASHGTRHGFKGSVPAPGGTRTVCVVAENYGGGADRILSCQRLNLVK